MILLNGHSLVPARKFTPESWAPALIERVSTGNLTIGPGGPELGIGDWLRDEEEPGGGTVWRVRGIEEDRNSRGTTYQLEHVIATLQDTCMFGEHTTAEIAGAPRATTVDARTAVEFCLNYQGDWVLGDFDFELSAPFAFNGESVLDGLETITGALDGAQWEYDLSSYPFTLHIRQRDTAAACEMRFGRNMSTLRIRRDRGKMYTRIYPIGKNDLHLPEEYLEENAQLYGRVDKIVTDQSIGDVAMLRTWAAGLLRRHSEPARTVTISGLELSQRTGETLDRLTVNRICMVPDPGYGDVFEARIVRLQWRDKIREPENVTVTLANELEDVARIINQMNKSGGRGGRAAAKDQKEDHAWFVDTDTHVAMVAEAIIGRNGQGVDWSRVSQIIVDGEGIHQRVTAAEGDIVMQQAQIDLNETRILQEVTDRTSADATLSGRIAVQADKISLVVEETVVEGETVNVVKAASIVAAINEAGSSVTISADKINLLGQVIANTITAEYISGQIATLPTLSGITGEFTGTVTAAGVIANGIYVKSNGANIDISDGIAAVQISGPVSGVYTLQYKKFSQSAWQNAGTFSKAATLSVAYGGDNTGDTATYTVTGTPADNFPNGNEKTGSFKVHQNKAAAWITDPEGTIRARIDNTQYGSGWAAACGEVSLPTSSNTTASFDVSTPNSTVDGDADTETYTLSSASDDIAVVKNKAGTVVARLEHGKHTAGKIDGWDLARGFVKAPDPGTGASMSVGIPASTYNQSSSYAFTVSVDNSYAYIKNALNQVVAQVSNPAHCSHKFGELTNVTANGTYLASANNYDGYTKVVVAVPIPPSINDYGISSDESKIYIKSGDDVVREVSNDGAHKAGRHWTACRFIYNSETKYIETYGEGEFANQMNAHVLPAQMDGFQFKYQSAMSTRSSGPYSGDQSYAMSSGYKYGQFWVEVCGVRKYIAIRITS